MHRFAITHLEKGGLRALAFANQGRNHYDTQAQATAALEMYRDGLEKQFGMVSLEVRPVDCYDHGDAKGIYFETDFRPVNGIPPFTATCCACKKDFVAGIGVDEHGREFSTMFADATGTPWCAYYCGPCSKAARELQQIVRSGR